MVPVPLSSMPRPKNEATDKPETSAEAETLRPFSVILDGNDVTIFAKDEEDLQARIAKRRSPTPLNLE